MAECRIRSGRDPGSGRRADRFEERLARDPIRRGLHRHQARGGVSMPGRDALVPRLRAADELCQLPLASVTETCGMDRSPWSILWTIYGEQDTIVRLSSSAGSAHPASVTPVRTLPDDAPPRAWTLRQCKSARGQGIDRETPATGVDLADRSPVHAPLPRKSRFRRIEEFAIGVDWVVLSDGRSANVAGTVRRRGGKRPPARRTPGWPRVPPARRASASG